MTTELLLAFAGFVFASSITPGPNNAMLLSSGLTYGFRRSLPHIAGISAGCIAMLAVVGLGMGAVFAARPEIYRILRWVGAAYLLWLAWTIARAGRITGGALSSRPLTFWQAAGFQWANPKAWLIIVGAATAYLPHEGVVTHMAAMGLLMGSVMVPCGCAWTSCGAALGRLLSDARHVRVFNGAMALLLVLSVLPILAE